MSLWIDFLGAEIRWVNVDGVATRVVRTGRGDPAFVLLHGRGGHLEGWSANVREMARHGQVIAFDLLGHGMTGRHAGDYGVAELTAHATRTLDILGVSDAVLVGQSLGGWVATHIALERPDLARALVLVEPAGLQTEADRLADPKVAAAYQRGGRAFAQPTADNVRTRLLGLVSDPSVIDEELVQMRLLLYAPAEARGVHHAVRAADNTALVLTPATMAGLTLPVLIIHGALANTPSEVVAEAARAAHARLVTIEGAKQWPQAERPLAVNRLIADFGRSANASPLPALNG